MKRKHKTKLSTKLFILAGILILLSIFILIHEKRLVYSFEGAYLSTQADCFPTEITRNWSIGEASVSPNQTITITIKNEQEPYVYRHELCHVNQFIQHRGFSCAVLPMVFVNEFECYWKTDNSPLTQEEQTILQKYFNN